LSACEEIELYLDAEIKVDGIILGVTPPSAIHPG
jgi:hypothetical protein